MSFSDAVGVGVDSLEVLFVLIGDLIDGQTVVAVGVVAMDVIGSNLQEIG